MVTLEVPVRDVYVRYAVQTRCPASFAVVTVDFEPPSDPGGGVELVDQQTSGDRLRQDLLDAFHEGLRQGLSDPDGAPVLHTRVVIRRALVHGTDSHPWDFHRAGQMAAEQILSSLPSR